ncbi:MULTISPECIES: HEPN domain-containing protein [unclassified Oceanispirochaeta]|uniref:HEPN domain-containing protein n=1 Tax=unclassified Oceanispirochaeta TaxID=2635722 RepID=UPI000E09B08E|nr:MULTISPECIES: HEPN domain-containing protein [unclassified Oceanispirochaeta]MBF9018622.1 hypothetical protein [Oceanispirochaeta sp. M2]NPD75059.1 hypothetical protein [Oceanispirochaeta sp. M1]RDG29085.1 hypothetical protein DV872_23465 [Oceanispirochaeta sp. M1]
MHNKIHRRIFYSNFNFVKAYRYKNFFQYYPIDSNIDHKIVSDCEYPILLEYNIEKTDFYQNQFIKDRYSELEKKIKQNHNGILDQKSKEWLEQHRLSTSMELGRAISMEIIYLLNFFLNKAVSFYPNRSFWVSNKVVRDDNDELEVESFKSIWAQLGYRPNREIEDIDTFYNYSDYYQSEDFINFKSYYSELRKSIDLRKEKPQQYELPDTLSIFLDTYFNLKKYDKRKFYFAIRNFYHAEKIRNEIKSYGFFALITAIESIGDFSKENIAQEFMEFMRKWSGRNSEEDIVYFKKLYKFRSDVAHGKFLRQDMPDSGFISDSDDFEPEVMYSSGLFQNVILNWFIATHVNKD